MIIAVCDDDAETLIWVAAALKEHYRNRPYNCNLQLFTDAGDLLHQIKEGYRPCLIFLNIKEESISAARAIRNLVQDCVLVLMACTVDYALEGYSVHAYSYLIKPFHVGNVIEILQSIDKNICRSIELRINGSSVQIPCSELAYLESEKHHILFHAHNRSIKAIGKLDFYEEMLKNNKTFIRCHQSFLVNMNYIKDAKGNNFLLLDGTIVPIRRREAAKCKAQYYSYIIGVN
jgi:two-component system, LytTR family, response regulator LytT